MTFTFISAGDEVQIIIYPNSVTVNAGNSVLFACAAYGNPAPGFVWMRGDDTNITTRDPRINITQELVEGNGIMFVQSILEFCTVVVSDSSQYSCTAVASQNPVPQAPRFNSLSTCYHHVCWHNVLRLYKVWCYIILLLLILLQLKS